MDEATLKAIKMVIGSLMLIVGDLWLSLDDINECLLYWGVDKSLQLSTVRIVVSRMTRQGALVSNRIYSDRFYRSHTSSINCADPVLPERDIVSVLPCIDNLSNNIREDVRKDLSCLNSILRRELLEMESSLPPVGGDWSELRRRKG
jgi:hypothetical protein